MPPKKRQAYNKTLSDAAQASSKAAHDFYLDAITKDPRTTFLSECEFKIRSNQTVENLTSKSPDLDNTEKCVIRCIEAIDTLYKASKPVAQQIISEMVNLTSTPVVVPGEASAGHASKLVIEPFPIFVSGSQQEVYDFKTKKISICPLEFVEHEHGQPLTFGPKADFMRSLAHEMAHALDDRVNGYKDVRTRSHQAVVQNIASAPSPDNALRTLRCLATLVDPSHELRTEYLDREQGIEKQANANMSATPAEFVAFSFETAFDSLARGQTADDFRAQVTARLQGAGYGQDTIAAAQNALRDLSEAFLAALPPNTRTAVQPLYDIMLDPALHQQQAHVQQAQAIHAPPLLQQGHARGVGNQLPTSTPRRHTSKPTGLISSNGTSTQRMVESMIGSLTYAVDSSTPGLKALPVKSHSQQIHNDRQIETRRKWP